MILTIDVGNSRMKAALFAERTGADTEAVIAAARKPLKTRTLSVCGAEDLRHFVESATIAGQTVGGCLVAVTGELCPSVRKAIHELSQGQEQYLDEHVPLPIRNRYATPQTLGADRLAAAVAGWYEGGCCRPVLIIDAGTAITYDFVTAEGDYVGGNISAGLRLRLQALHEHTAHLPLVEVVEDSDEEIVTKEIHSSISDEEEQRNPIRIGANTSEALRQGALQGMRYEIEGYVREYLLKYPNILIIRAGGTMIAFEKTLKSRTFAHPNLVLEGLYLIQRYALLTTKK